MNARRRRSVPKILGQSVSLGRNLSLFGGCLDPPSCNILAHNGLNYTIMAHGLRNLPTWDYAPNGG
jgi:hypothetical protein